MKQLALLAAVAGSLSPVSVRGAVHDVPATFATITAAIAAASAGDTVQVASGTYSPSTNGETFPLLVTTDLRLIGAGLESTLLDAEGTSRVLDFQGPGGGRISGFTITGGFASDGGGLWIRDGSPEVDHNLFVANSASSRGAGMFVGSATGPNAAPHVHHNVLWENVDGNPADSTDAHGIVVGASATGVFEHNLVGRTDGNGLLTQATAAPSVRHMIFLDNGSTNPQPRGRGICWLSSPPPSVYHNLFFGNQIAALLWPAGGGDFSGATANAADSLDGIYGNLDGDPLLVDPDNGDFSLQAGSPAIDAGDPTLPLDPDGTIADLGPFYFPQPPVGVGPRTTEAVHLIRSAPNPFQARTRILFSLASPGGVRVDVLDVRGRLIRRLQDGDLDAGMQAVSWDGRTDDGGPVPSGVYLVRVTTERGRQTARVVHLR
jgi:hypothetical protein